MKLPYRLTIIVFSLVTLLMVSCIFTTEPVAESRNYVWELDTLDMPMNYISTVWGASSGDVWAMGEGGTEHDRLLHFDGNEWSTYTDEIIWCSGSKIFGFSEDNIWMAGGAGWLEHGAGIWHYDGDKWKQFYVYDIEENNHGIYPMDLWGDSPENVYVSGVISFYDGKHDSWRGFVLHYNGVEWKELLKADFNSKFYTVRDNGEDVFLYSHAVDTIDLDIRIREIYKISSDYNIKKIFQYNEDNYGANISCVNEEIFFVIDHDVCRYKQNKFVPFLHIDNEHFFYQVHGRSINDLFISMDDGIAHYNGEDIEYLYHFPNESMHIIEEPCILENDIYYSIWNPGSSSFNLILHGKLVEE